MWKSPVATRATECGRTVLLLALLAFTTSPIAAERTIAPAKPIKVTALQGHVAVTMNGREAPAVHPGTVLELPTWIATGADGAMRIRQSATTISLGPDSEIEIPVGAAKGDLIARIVQHRGSVFYDVQEREVSRLRVDTPYLVAVIKGTQFNVTVQPDSTTISLFEGRLEVRSPDGAAVVQLDAGEIAIRSSADSGIRVLSMGDEPNDRQVDARSVGGDSLARAADAATPDSSRATVERMDAGDALRSLVREGTDADVEAGAALQADRATLGIRSSLDLGDATADLSAGAHLDLGDTTVDLGADATLDVGDATAELGADASLDLGDATVDLGADASLDLGDATVDLGADASLDLGEGTADLGTDATLAFDDATVDLSADAGLDLGDASAGLDTQASVELGDAGAELGAGADLDLGDATAGLGSDASLDLGAATADLAAEAGLDLGDGTVDLGLDADLGIGDVILELDVDTTIDLRGITDLVRSDDGRLLGEPL